MHALAQLFKVLENNQFFYFLHMAEGIKKQTIKHVTKVLKSTISSFEKLQFGLKQINS